MTETQADIIAELAIKLANSRRALMDARSVLSDTRHAIANGRTAVADEMVDRALTYIEGGLTI